jgi:hypothetical protein
MLLGRETERPTNYAVLMPTKALTKATTFAVRNPLPLQWRSWGWTMAASGVCDYTTDPTARTLTFTGSILGLPVEVMFPLGADASGFCAVLCPVCEKRLPRNKLLVACRRGDDLVVGCTRCVPPPSEASLPSVTEVRGALEALSRRG